MGKRYEAAVERVRARIEARKILTAYNALDHEDTTVGPYTEAVDRGTRFAVIGWRGRRSQYEARTSRDAACEFVDRVGEGRAREAALSR